ncbi:unnamed protein product [Rotaria magnacalcarata]|uniref:NAD(P)(+)--arginine ADP-ribosyltransferase n=1 Tax=Rotaria magnacalcarata TaxID=392030 RepID=A0A815EZB4_9BILA|nr:unnamed protein product [Rotaria magnacalcarata]
MHRFTDIESTSKRLPPVYGYLTHQLLPLQEALKPISSQVDQLDRFSRIAKNECKFPSEHGLTRDESAAIYLYTMEWGEDSFYKVINRYLRAEDRSTLQPWFGYLKLFDTAVQKLPTVRKNLWRGIAADIAKNFKNGHEFTWWAISSCSTSVNIIKDFLGSNSTLFLIEAVNGKDISGYTNFPKESEVILCPGTRLRVVSDPLDHAPMRVVHLQEISDEAEDQLTSSFDAMSLASSSEKKSIPTAITAKSSEHGKGTMDFASGAKYTGDWVDSNMTGQGLYIFASGARYEGQWKDGKYNGKGKMNFANGEMYTGDWVDSNMTGQGLYIYASGARYE